MISIHAPTKGATDITKTIVYFYQFQSTLPRRERHQIIFNPTDAQLFQSTLPRRERHGQFRSFNKRVGISIHAPTKGATLSSENSFSNIHISIHAPTKGATLKKFKNPEISAISIHAPTKGATSKQCREHQKSANFNPRSHEGSDR